MRHVMLVVILGELWSANEAETDVVNEYLYDI